MSVLAPTPPDRQYFRIAMCELRIRCTLAAARQRASAPGAAKPLLTQAERGIKRLRKASEIDEIERFRDDLVARVIAQAQPGEPA